VLRDELFHLILDAQFQFFQSGEAVQILYAEERVLRKLFDLKLVSGVLLGQALKFGVAAEELLAKFPRRGGHQLASRSWNSPPYERGS
jgi:hypothetical protein